MTCATRRWNADSSHQWIACKLPTGRYQRQINGNVFAALDDDPSGDARKRGEPGLKVDSWPGGGCESLLLLTRAVRRDRNRVRAPGHRPARTVADKAYRQKVDGVRGRDACEGRGKLAYLGCGSYGIAHDGDASSEHQRF